jgi:hypothetical protein
VFIRVSKSLLEQRAGVDVSRIGAILTRVSVSLRIAAIARPAEVEFSFEGRTLRAPAGESLAAALLASGVLRLGEGPGAPRALFCMMGTCQQCLLRVDGKLAQACLTPVRAGLVVQTA